MDTVAPYGARWNREDRLLKRRGEVEERASRGVAERGEEKGDEKATAAGGRKRGESGARRNSGRSARECRQARGKSEKGRRRNKSGKNESIGGVFHDAPLEALQVGGAR